MDATHQLQERLYGSSSYRCPSGYTLRGSTCYRSSWYSWGRWVLVAVLIAAVLFFLMICACCIRRRRSKGAKPIYGTGWMAGGGKKWGKNNTNTNAEMNNYNQTYPQQGHVPEYNQQGPPSYGNQQQPQYTGTTFNPNDGYYGNQQNVQQPVNAYNPNQTYAPPRDAPPGK